MRIGGIRGVAAALVICLTGFVLIVADVFMPTPYDDGFE